MMYVDGTWNDVNCDFASFTFQYLCEKGPETPCEDKMLAMKNDVCVSLGCHCWNQYAFFCCENHEYFAWAVCTPGYEENGGRCYKLVTTTATGKAAQAACEAEGTNLVSISDAAEETYVKKKLG